MTKPAARMTRRPNYAQTFQRVDDLTPPAVPDGARGRPTILQSPPEVAASYSAFRFSDATTASSFLQTLPESGMFWLLQAPCRPTPASLKSCRRECG